MRRIAAVAILLLVGACASPEKVGYNGPNNSWERTLETPQDWQVVSVKTKSARHLESVIQTTASVCGVRVETDGNRYRIMAITSVDTTLDYVVFCMKDSIPRWVSLVK